MKGYRFILAGTILGWGILGSYITFLPLPAETRNAPVERLEVVR